MLTVDAHAHISSWDVGRYPTAPVGGDTRDRALEAETFPAENLIEEMTAQGVNHAIAVQRAHIYGYNNSYVCDAAGHSPELLSAVVAVDSSNPAGANAASHWVRNHRARGLRFVFPGRPDRSHAHRTGWLDGQNALAVWRQAEMLEVPVCVHLMRPIREAGIATVARIAAEFPSVSIILDHLGNITAEQGPPSYGLDELSAIADLANVSFKVTPINFRAVRSGGFDLIKFVRAAADRVGASRLMYGTDVTNSPGAYRELLDAGRAATQLLDADDQADFLGRTAARIYQLPSEGVRVPT